MPIALESEPGPMTRQDFLAWEAEQEERHEFVDGRPRAMAGGTRAYGIMAQNIAFALRSRLEKGPCFPMQEQNVFTAKGSYRYPDVTVDCSPSQGMRDLAAEEPRVVFEVISPSNTLLEQMERLGEFQATTSIQHIVVLSQTSMQGRVYSRRGAGWESMALVGEDACVELSAIGCQLTFSEVYKRVDFAPPAANA